MSDTKIAPLDDRGVVRVSGEDADSFLDNLVTNDVTGMADGEARFAALLTPQGKILFDFFVVRMADGYLLEVARDKAVELVKRLTLYKLRAKVDITDASGGAYHVMAHWPDAPAQLGAPPKGSVLYRDPRHSNLGTRAAIRVPGEPEQSRNVMMINPTKPYDDYHAHRISLGIPEGGKDYAYGDAFPHEANMDRLAGISFTKGCFVGQEVVARMQHKTVVRKRVVRVEAPGSLASGTEVKAGEAVIGSIGSVSGTQGLAMLRLDRVIEALDKGEAVNADGQPLTVDKTMLEWFRGDSTTKAAEKAARI
jgi:tRNA-modifying protein YgfZ